MSSTEEEQAPQHPKPSATTERRWARLWKAMGEMTRHAWIGARELARNTRLRIVAIWIHPQALALRARLRRTGQSARALGAAVMPRLKRSLRQTVLLGGACALIIALVLGLGRFSLRAIPAGQVGVRYSKWSGEGVSMTDFGPGLHLSLPGVHKWYELPSGSETLSWRPDQEDGLLNVRTSDGTSVQLALTIPYSIVENEAHLLMAKGLRSTFREQARALAEQVLGNDLGTLSSEDYSQTEVRSALSEQSLTSLNKALAGIHLRAEAILVESVSFSPAFEKKLVETQRERQRSRVLIARQLEDQEQQTILRRRSAIDRELLDRRIELDVEIESVRAAGQAQAAERVREVSKAENELRADADRDYELLIAEGEAALAQTKQEEARFRGQILAGPGGPEYLALEAARSTRFKDVLMDSNDPRVPNPLNLDLMLGLFGLVQSPENAPQ